MRVLAAGTVRRWGCIAGILATIALLVSPVPALGATPPLRGPVIAGEWPDPEVVHDPVGGRYWAFATNFPLGGVWVNVPVRSSPDLADWSTFHFDALPNLPAWASVGHTWAPGVARIGEQWVLFFTARHTASDRQCIGVATSSTVSGPYVPQGSTPLVCQLDLGGSIDGSPFLDPSTQQWWLHWKSDENAPGVAAPQPRIWAQALTAGGLGLAGSPTPILGVVDLREWPLVEGPEMVATPTGLLLFYGANLYETANYMGHWARCSGPAGPCQRQVSPADPWLDSSGGVPGPGGISVVQAPNGRSFAAFHGWIGAVGYGAGGNRAMFLEPVTFDGPDGAPRLRVELPRNVAPPPPLASGPTAARLPDGMHAFYAADGGAVIDLAVNEMAATSLGGVIRDNPDAAASTSGGAVVARGTDDAVWIRRHDGRGWLPWTSLGGSTLHGPAVASWSGPRLDVFATGLDGQLWHRWSSDGTSWSHWEPLGGGLTSGPDVAAWGTGRLDVVVRGTDGAVHHLWFEQRWSGWESLGGQVLGGPGVAAADLGRLSVVGRGLDDAVWIRSWNPGWSAWSSLGGVTYDEPDVAGTAGSVAVFARLSDNGLWRHELGGWALLS